MCLWFIFHFLPFFFSLLLPHLLFWINNEWDHNLKHCGRCSEKLYKKIARWFGVVTHLMPPAAIVLLLGFHCVPVPLRSRGLLPGKPILNLSIAICVPIWRLKTIVRITVYRGALTWVLQLPHTSELFNSLFFFLFFFYRLAGKRGGKFVMCISLPCAPYIKG